MHEHTEIYAYKYYIYNIYVKNEIANNIHKI